MSLRVSCVAWILQIVSKSLIVLWPLLLRLHSSVSATRLRAVAHYGLGLFVRAFALAYDPYTGALCRAGITIGYAIAAANRVVLHGAHTVGLLLGYAYLLAFA
jgi:hypothetical protein